MSVLDGIFNNNYGLQQSQIEEIKQSFRSYDLNNDGYISRDELKQCLRCAHVTALDAVVDSTLKDLDWNHDGRISYGEYLKFMATIYRDEHRDLKRQLGSANAYVGSVTDGF
jgi:Ca2+-binding EF-hand superfamily protein